MDFQMRGLSGKFLFYTVGQAALNCPMSESVSAYSCY